MEIAVAPPKCTTTTDELAESLKCKERCKNAGITVSEYLINNYPPATTTFDENFNSNPATMVPLRNSAFNYLPKDNIKEHHDIRIHPYGMVDDEELKKVRRRIKNKISAQESRRRKKEYMDSLELRLTQKDQEKELLKNRVTELEEKVRLLVDDLFAVKQNNSNGMNETKMKHQEAILGMTRPKNILQISRGTQTGTCLQCFMRSRVTRRNDVERALMVAEDEGDSRVVPNLVMAENDETTNMADMSEREEDLKKESDDVDILSLSPVSSSSLIVPNVEDENMMKVDRLPAKSTMSEVDDEMMNQQMNEGEYNELKSNNRESSYTDIDKNEEKNEEETIYRKPNDPQQESLISQLMHTEHLVSPSI